MTPEPITISVARAVELTGMSRSTIYKHIREMRILSKKVCGRRLLDYAALKEIIAGDAMDAGDRSGMQSGTQK
jgi:hypothetical protein